MSEAKRIVVNVEYRSGWPINPREWGFHGDYPEDVDGAVVELRYEVAHTCVDSARMAAEVVRSDMLEAGALDVELHETIVQSARC